MLWIILMIFEQSNLHCISNSIYYMLIFVYELIHKFYAKIRLKLYMHCILTNVNRCGSCRLISMEYSTNKLLISSSTLNDHATTNFVHIFSSEFHLLTDLYRLSVYLSTLVCLYIDSLWHGTLAHTLSLIIEVELHRQTLKINPDSTIFSLSPSRLQFYP